MTQEMGLGIIGTNFVSDWMVDAIGQSRCFKAAAVYSRDAARGAAYAEKNGIPASYDDLDAFLADAAMDAVYIASPNSLHYPQAMRALRRGKHVLCEKPLALDGAQAAAMFRLARENGLVLLEAIRPVHDPFLQVVRAHLPEIGRVRLANFTFCQYSSRYDRFLSGEHVNIFDASLGNGAVMDLGVYCLHTCCALFGAPKRVHAAGSSLSNGVNAAGSVQLDYGDMQANITFSKVSDDVFPSFIQGERGTLTFDTLNGPAYVRLYRHDKHMEALQYDPEPNNMVYELRAFSRCIRGEESAAPWENQSGIVMGLLDEIRRQLGIDFGRAEQ